MIPLGPFDLESPLGKGGMGEVWLGIHRKRRVPVAVKVLMSERTRRPEYRFAFRQEVRSVAALDHPGVVRVYDYGEISKAAQEASDGRLLEGSPYLVMEWADQGTLSPLAGKLSWPAVQEILFQLLGALAHSHARGMIHRDIKPSNVLRFGSNAQSKLSDFGVAFAHERGAMPHEEGSASRRDGICLFVHADLSSNVYKRQQQH